MQVKGSSINQAQLDPLAVRGAEHGTTVIYGWTVVGSPMFSQVRSPAAGPRHVRGRAQRKGLGVHPVVDGAGADVDTLNDGLVTVPPAVDGLAVSDVYRIV